MNAPPRPEATAIPDKLFFRIGEVSELAGVPPSVLRFWENQFPRIRPRRTESGQRLYRRSEVELILTIKHLLYERRFTIKGARDFLKSRGRPSSAKSAEKEFVAEIRRELQRLRDLLS